MQLRIGSHLSAFDPPERILDAGQNVRRGAYYLMQAKARYGTWTAAVMRYHGGNEKQGRIYVCKIWNNLRYIAPASALLIDGKICGAMRRPYIDLKTARLAHEERARLTGASTAISPVLNAQ